MPEPVVENKEGEEAAPKVDAFGASDKPEAPVETEGGEGKEKKEEKKFAPIPDDHPTIVALKGEIEKVKSEYGGNLSGQRELIKTLEKKIDDLSKGKGGEGEADVLFKDIKRSKDLKPEEREEMTETEIKQMDLIADMQEAQNKMYADLRKNDKGSGEEKQNDLAGWVKDEARELARKTDGSVNVELANQIIEASKMFNFTGLDEDKVRERVREAVKHVPDYKPPKEQSNKKGKPVDGQGKAEDPFGVDAIVEEVSAGRKNKGSYNL